MRQYPFRDGDQIVRVTSDADPTTFTSGWDTDEILPPGTKGKGHIEITRCQCHSKDAYKDTGFRGCHFIFLRCDHGIEREFSFGYRADLAESVSYCIQQFNYRNHQCCDWSEIKERYGMRKEREIYLTLQELERKLENEVSE